MKTKIIKARRGKSFTPEEDRTLIDSIAKGMTYEQIGHSLNRTYKSIEKRRARISKGANGHIYTNTDIAKLRTNTGSRLGDITEIDMCAYFMKKGWEVFRNVSSCGPIDFVIFNKKTVKYYFIDAKTSNLSSKSGSFLHEKIHTAIFALSKVSEYETKTIVRLRNTINVNEVIEI